MSGSAVTGSSDADPHDGREETENERLDRNWTELLQELRVLQTGTQLLTGFLLTVAFQPAFAKLDRFEVVAYLVLVLLAAASTVLALAPVALHRALFGRRAKRDLVHAADRLLRVALGVVGLVITGVVVLVVDVVAGRTTSAVVGGIAVACIVVLWLVLPLRERHRHAVQDSARPR